MTDGERADHAKLLAEYRALEEEYEDQDELPEGIDARLGVLEAAMETLEARPLVFDLLDVGRAGALVRLDRDGKLAVYRGYVRPEDEMRKQVVVGEDNVSTIEGEGCDGEQTIGVYGVGTIITSNGRPLGTDLSDDEDDGVLKPTYGVDGTSDVGVTRGHRTLR